MLRMLRQLIGAIVTGALLCVMFSCSSGKNSAEKPALIVTTDIGGDPDDTQSLTRLLLYSNDIDILGLIASASGTRGELGVDTVKPELILRHIDAYEQVYPNLLQHDPGYPSPDLLRSVTKRGNPQRGMEFIGVGHDTEGSEWITSQVDAYQDGKVNIAIWGGQTDLAQALWKVKHERSEAAYQAFVSKIRVYDINDQDGIYAEIRKAHPGLFYILAKAPEGEDKREGAYRGMYLGGDESLTSREWIDANVIEDHGPLGAMYPTKTWTAPNPHSCLKEGDTPSWFFFLHNGLQDPDHPGWGGWGGRFLAERDSYYRDAEDVVSEEINARATVYRWRQAFQSDFASRMDRCVMGPDEVNHVPEVNVNADNSLEVISIAAKEGETITLNAAGTTDPDGDLLSYSLWTYEEAGTMQHYSELRQEQGSGVSFEIPAGEAGNELHLILEVTDNGDPALTAYRRIIIRIN